MCIFGFQGASDFRVIILLTNLSFRLVLLMSVWDCFHIEQGLTGGYCLLLLSWMIYCFTAMLGHLFSFRAYHMFRMYKHFDVVMQLEFVFSITFVQLLNQIWEEECFQEYIILGYYDVAFALLVCFKMRLSTLIFWFKKWGRGDIFYFIRSCLSFHIPVEYCVYL